MQNNKTYSNCKISNPILRPDLQLVSFNGFAWSDAMGIIHETVPINNNGWEQWLGTQQ
jgi:hypothetical protein